MELATRSYDAGNLLGAVTAELRDCP